MVVDGVEDTEDHGGNSQVFFYPVIKNVSLLLHVCVCGWLVGCMCLTHTYLMQIINLKFLVYPLVNCVDV